MESHLNTLGQPIGASLEHWTARPLPPRTPMTGHFCHVVPLDPDQHAAALFAANSLDHEARNWTYLPQGPFERFETYHEWLRTIALRDDPLFFTIVDAQTAQAVGLASFLRIDPTCGVIEIGWLSFSPLLQRTPGATEAMFLMMKRAFDELGYRRYEWKCDALNAPSRAAAQRLGFQFEGIFRQATIYNGRSRDTAWFSIIDQEWPTLRTNFEQWLDPSNFDAVGIQRQRLHARDTPPTTSGS